MIKLYYTKQEKYLEKGKFIKYFDENATIDGMLACIKDKNEQVAIYALPDVVFEHKYSQNTKSIYTYECLEEFQLLDENILNLDLDKLYSGIVNYIILKPIEKWQKVLGNRVYLVNNKELQKNIIETKDQLAFMIEDMQELVNGLRTYGEIPRKIIYKMFFDGKILENI